MDHLDTMSMADIISSSHHGDGKTDDMSTSSTGLDFDWLGSKSCWIADAYQREMVNVQDVCNLRMQLVVKVALCQVRWVHRLGH